MSAFNPPNMRADLVGTSETCETCETSASDTLEQNWTLHHFRYFERTAKHTNTSCENIHIHHHGNKTCYLYNMDTSFVGVSIQTGAFGMGFFSCFFFFSVVFHPSAAAGWLH